MDGVRARYSLVLVVNVSVTMWLGGACARCVLRIKMYETRLMGRKTGMTAPWQMIREMVARSSRFGLVGLVGMVVEVGVAALKEKDDVVEALLYRKNARWCRKKITTEDHPR